MESAGPVMSGVWRAGITGVGACGISTCSAEKSVVVVLLLTVESPMVKLKLMPGCWVVFD
jgi:hypothetical protein